LYDDSVIQYDPALRSASYIYTILEARPTTASSSPLPLRLTFRMTQCLIVVMPGPDTGPVALLTVPTRIPVAVWHHCGCGQCYNFPAKRRQCDILEKRLFFQLSVKAIQIVKFFKQFLPFVCRFWN